MNKLTNNLGRALIAGMLVALPVYAGTTDLKPVMVAFAANFIGWLAVAYNVQTQRAMNMSPKE